MATILITGGTGTIGSALSRALLDAGHSVIVLTRGGGERSINARLRFAQWDVLKGSIDRDALAEADAVVHLAGANVADGRWTEKRKQEIVRSRVDSGNLLVQALRDLPNKVQTVISASAIGWYGPDPQVPNPRPFMETDAAASDTFLGSTCQQWESAIRPVEGLGKRLVIARIGIMLSRAGGAYAEFRKPMRFGLAPVMGSGKQVVSWIHIGDLVRFFINAIEDTRFSGVYNAVAPAPVTNAALVKAIAAAKGGLAVPLPAPAFALKAALGEMSVEVLKSATVSSRKLQETGFHFLYPDIASAARNLEGR
ncbi:TIGR01777 family protein [Flaviaesturariibacter flavus]|uniref:TIGR01777 family protein n=1 Tax=Flaviaesturariibacter flavus TaxID=2502780 RepID=A0A4R1BC63_9BACT|nr:TIGR01777 family oxidoreductase [Flaviaesturariibacter flavus]TCJ14528.1 TIGR01777 family protein [Flaviaesturariibacter flavus]